MNNVYLFVLSPPYSGSTLLSELLKTSENISSLPQEGQFLEGVQDVIKQYYEFYKTIPEKIICTDFKNFLPVCITLRALLWSNISS